MVDVMAGALEDYDFSEEVAGSMGIGRKTDDKDIVDADVEDGELPEEGEICDDEDAEGRDFEMAENYDLAERAPSDASVGQLRTRKPRDFDREEVAVSKSAESSMLSSWMTGVKQRTKPGIVTVASPSVDANEEYYGYGTCSPIDASGDKDYRNRAAGDTADKDYRWIRDEDGQRGPNEVNEFGDSDYRSGSPKLERRRRRSLTPTNIGPKRPRPSPPVRGGYRGRGLRGRWGERQICKFFREGYCRDGENCSYSHDAADSGRKAELCKFYQQGFCKKGLQCPLLHGEYPCKAFHKGECSKDPCQFSHLALNSFTQPIFEQMIKDDELASRIAIPQGPLKRRVLLPGGPCSSPGAQSAVPVIVTVTSDGGLPGGMLPPPSVVVPTLSSTAPSVTVAQPQLVIPPPLTGNQTPYPAFFPHHSVPVTSVVNPTATVPGLLPPHSAQNAAIILQHYTGNFEKRIAQEDEEDSSFNISKMLEQITAKVKKDNALEESPASPPMFSLNAVASAETKTIPEMDFPVWKLLPVDDIPSPQANIDSKLLQMSLTDSGLRNDPRIKKALASQFDAFTNSLMNAAPPPLPQPAQIFQQHSSVTASTSVASQSAVNSFLSKEEPNVPKMSGSRMTTGRDPRKKITVSDPRISAVNDPRLVQTVARTVDQRLASTNGLNPVGQSPSTSTARHGADHLYAIAVNPQNQIRDQDHRALPSKYENMSSHFEEYSTERIGGYDGRRVSGGGWMPQARVSADPRQIKRHGVGGFRNELNSNHDRDERELVRARRDGNRSPPPVAATANTAPQAPLSLREKRKNNEYESPLSKIPEKTRWA